MDNDGSINLLLVNWIAKMNLPGHGHKLLPGNEDLIATMVDHPEKKKNTFRHWDQNWMSENIWHKLSK